MSGSLEGRTSAPADRYVYAHSHVDVAEVMVRLGTLAHRIRGERTEQSPPLLRHFTSHFAAAGAC